MADESKEGIESASASRCWLLGRPAGEPPGTRALAFPSFPTDDDDDDRGNRHCQCVDKTGLAICHDGRWQPPIRLERLGVGRLEQISVYQMNERRATGILEAGEEKNNRGTKHLLQVKIIMDLI
ncbi:hypothetical protein C2845_PM09G05890 [Panicum miliaceum]|uniref:Uncharacterized protein n=1 Tax=Panicum miliaceum TaxID=4540 RepID=A0A3L6S197_PANMI|nr:hypothetical protein C2845_PM09G05890 [Panicum miliaceum]